VSVRRYSLLALVVLALGGCTQDDGEETMATKPAGNAPADEPATTADEPVAPAQRRRVRLLRLGTFNEPTYVTAPRGDRRRFVVEREGTIRIVQRGRVLARPFLDISDRVTTEGEGGLLSMAFARDYASSRRFYVYYTDQQGFIQIDQFLAGAAARNRADPSSRRSVIRVPHHRFNHKGGQLQVSADGMLYAGFGDGGSGGDPDENAQNLGRLLGKMIRIDPRPDGGYSIPATNPFRDRSGARPEIYAYGLRNPYRFSFDRRRGHLTVGDVGQNEVEEIDYVPSRAGRPPRGGYNFGWDAFEGRNRYESGSAPGHVPPVLQHTHDQEFCSITGGYVIRDRSLGRGWTGRYIYGDFCNGTLRLARLQRPNAATHGTRMSVANLVSFGEDSRGRVYAVSLDGPVYRIGRR
jgi:glucose/arabinose dehydrogenase